MAFYYIKKKKTQNFPFPHDEPIDIPTGTRINHNPRARVRASKAFRMIATKKSRFRGKE